MIAAICISVSICGCKCFNDAILDENMNSRSCRLRCSSKFSIWLSANCSNEFKCSVDSSISLCLRRKMVWTTFICHTSLARGSDFSRFSACELKLEIISVSMGDPRVNLYAPSRDPHRCQAHASCPLPGNNKIAV